VDEMADPKEFRGDVKPPPDKAVVLRPESPSP